MIKESAEKNGFNPNFALRPGVNDATVFSNYANVKSICMSPGQFGQQHRIDKHVEKKGLFASGQTILDIVKRVAL